MLNIKINKYKQCNSFRSIYNDGLKTTVRNPRLITLQYLLLVRSIGVIRRGLLMFQYSPRDEWRVSESDQTWIIDVPILSTRDEWRVSESDQTWIIDDEWRPIQIHFNLIISTSDVSADKLFYWITRSKNMV